MSATATGGERWWSHFDYGS